MYYTLVARLDDRELSRDEDSNGGGRRDSSAALEDRRGLVALLSWGVAGDDGRVPSSLNLAAVVGDCAGSCPEVTVESSKAAQYSSALDAASLLQRHGFASLRIEGAGDVTLAVEMPPDSYGRLEATATLIVDVFVDGAAAHQFWRPPNCVATTIEAGRNCSAYANATFVETAAAYGVAGRREPRAEQAPARRVRFSFYGRHRRRRPSQHLRSTRRAAYRATLGVDRHSRRLLRGVAGLRAPVPGLARDALGGPRAPPARPALARHEPRRLPGGRRRRVFYVARAAGATTTSGRLLLWVVL